MSDTPKIQQAAEGGCPPATCSASSDLSKTWQDLLAILMLEMPFGKYIGKRLCDIPLRYLDETVSVMPPTLLVRLAQRALEIIQLDTGSNMMVEGRVTDATFREAFKFMIPAMNKCGQEWRTQRIKEQDEVINSLQNV